MSADRTIIAWTEHTWNPWRGCTKISPGCAHCYMFTAQRRYGQNPEIVLKTATWDKPRRWNRVAEQNRSPAMVFTCSWSDWFHDAADQWRPAAWQVVRECPWLQFQILTKRHERIVDHLPPDWGPDGYPNVWLGVSIENHKFVHRADTLRTIPAVVRFLSLEPLLGPLPTLDVTGIDWMIVGGESGARFRPMHTQWARDLRALARAHGIAFFFKQSAALMTESGIKLDGQIVREYPTPRGSDR